MTDAERQGWRGLLWLFCSPHRLTRRVSGDLVCHECGYNGTKGGGD